MPKVLVYGDPLVDRYVTGGVHRISPEAPIPIFSIKESNDMTGGALNVFKNVFSALNCARMEMDQNGTSVPIYTDDVFICGVAGEAMFETVFVRQKWNRINTYRSRTLQIKTRFIAQYGMMVMRTDTEKQGPISGMMELEVIDTMRSLVKEQGEPSVVIIADYGCGSVTANICRAIRNEIAPHGIVIVDPHPSQDLEMYGSADYAVPNESELEAHGGVSAYLDVVSHLIVTRGGDPIHYYTTNTKDPIPFVTPHRDVVDPCGAGDAFVAYFAAELAQNRPTFDALRVAAHAGAVAVSRRGVHVVTPEEVQKSMAESN